MGKNASKHVHRPCDIPANDECFLVNAHLNKAWEEQIWKKTTKTGYNLANYNMNQSMSELSICLEDKPGNLEKKENNKDNNIPLKVELPPIKSNGSSGKVFTVDQADDTPEKDDLKSHLNIEEFECGVHFGGGENSKQEWSFTLYDFDGHGKITKEDLVGLLKALYDAIGSSIKIPNNGTKTLKLRLSVGQETNVSADTGQTAIAGKLEEKPINTNRDEKDNAVKAKNTPKKKDTAKVKDKENSKSKDKTKDVCKVKVKDISRLNNLVGSSSAKGTPKCTNETQSQIQNAKGQEAAATKVKMPSHKHKELVNLVQENMERNHIRPLRRHHSDCRGCRKEHPHYKRRQRAAKATNATKESMKPLQASGESPQKASPSDDTPKECQDRRNYYLDLAGVENNTSKFQDCTSSALENSGMDTSLTTTVTTELNNSQTKNTSSIQPVKTHSALTAGQFCVPRHNRSRSHELQVAETCEKLIFDPSGVLTQPVDSPVVSHIKSADHFRSRSFDPQDSNISNIRAMKGNPPILATTGSPNPKTPRFRPVSLPTNIPENISPHYHRRHRHREKDHDMAMQQVAEWIEREHSLDYEGEKVIVQRHEHHHVHEHHHHHHYHHYYEA